MAGFKEAWTRASARVKQAVTSAGAADGPSLSHFLAPGECPEEVWREVSGEATSVDDHDMDDFVNLLAAAKQDSKTRARRDAALPDHDCYAWAEARKKRERTEQEEAAYGLSRVGSVRCAVSVPNGRHERGQDSPRA